jgi:hypothetical protein
VSSKLVEFKGKNAFREMFVRLSEYASLGTMVAPVSELAQSVPVTRQQ